MANVELVADELPFRPIEMLFEVLGFTNGIIVGVNVDVGVVVVVVVVAAAAAAAVAGATSGFSSDKLPLGAAVIEP